MSVWSVANKSGVVCCCEMLLAGCGRWDKSGEVMVPKEGPCEGGLAFAEAAAAASSLPQGPLDSWQLSRMLLGEVYGGAPSALRALSHVLSKH